MGVHSTLDITEVDARTYIQKGLESASPEQLASIMDTLYYSLYYNFSVEPNYGRWRKDMQFCDKVDEFDSYLEEKGKE